MNRILTEENGKRIAVIENEFGEVGVLRSDVDEGCQQWIEVTGGGKADADCVDDQRINVS